jgi:hypothetical protein
MLSRAWKAAAVLVVLVGIGAGAAIAWVNYTKPKPLGLPSPGVHSPAPTPSPNDPFADTCKQPASPPGATPSGLSGVWAIQPGSMAGYRAREKFAELPSPHEAVARTDRVLGWIQISDSSGSLRIESGCVVVDLVSLRSVDELPGFNTADRDKNARDFLHTSLHPYAVFRPRPANLPAGLAGGGVQRVGVGGELELNGTVRAATFSLQVRLRDQAIAAAGQTGVNVSDFGIEVPTTVGDFVAVDPHLTLEISMTLLRS